MLEIQVPENLIDIRFDYAYIVDAAHGLTIYPYSDFAKRLIRETHDLFMVFRANTIYKSIDIRADDIFPHAFDFACFNGGGGHPCAAGFPIKE